LQDLNSILKSGQRPEKKLAVTKWVSWRVELREVVTRKPGSQQMFLVEDY
jgi:hypothetical protein